MVGDTIELNQIQLSGAQTAQYFVASHGNLHEISHCILQFLR